MKDVEPGAARTDANHCFVCGPDNPIGLRVRYTVEANRCHGEFTSQAVHAGFDGITHGGIVFSVLDDAMANWFFLQGARGFTAKAEIRYRAPMPLGATAAVSCTLIRRKGRLVELAAHASDRDAGTLFAEAQASFMLDDPSALPDF